MTRDYSWRQALRFKEPNKLTEYRSPQFSVSASSCPRLKCLAPQCEKHSVCRTLTRSKFRDNRRLGPSPGLIMCHFFAPKKLPKTPPNASFYHHYPRRLIDLESPSQSLIRSVVVRSFLNSSSCFSERRHESQYSKFPH